MNCKLSLFVEFEVTDGHEKMDTIAIPIIIADLNRNAMRYAVRNPPKIMPIHICEKLVQVLQ